MPAHRDEDPRRNLPTWLRLAIMGLILYSIITVCLETVPELSQYAWFFKVSETIVVVIFTVEYFGMWYLSDDRWRYPFRPMSIIDLLAILPFYLHMGIDLRAIRADRLLRIFRVLKLGRHSRAIQTVGEALRRSSPELSVTAFAGGIFILISAMALYYAENRAQPDVFSSIPASLWWAVVTLTTVGYGDVYPVTTLGRVIASIIMLIGIGMIAVPTSILASTFSDLLHERRDERAQTSLPAETSQSHSEDVENSQP